jgi:hypothetical protein
MLELIIVIIGFAIIIPLAIFSDRPLRYEEEEDKLDIQPLLGVAYPNEPTKKDERE